MVSFSRNQRVHAGLPRMGGVAMLAMALACASAASLTRCAGESAATGEPAASAAATRVELQPLAAQVRRLLETLDYIGAPLAAGDRRAVEAAIEKGDGAQSTGAVERVLDRYVLLEVGINPESRVHVTQGSARPDLVQNGWRTFLVKVRNAAGVTAPLKVESPQGQR